MKLNNKGFTLIEIMCSVALLAIIITASASFITSVNYSQQNSREQLYANNIAQEVIEEVIRTGDITKDYSANYDGYTVEVNATSAPIGSGSGGDGTNFGGEDSEEEPETTQIPWTYDTTGRIPEEGTRETPGPTGTGPFRPGRPDKYSINLDTSDYMEDDLCALYYAGVELYDMASNSPYEDEDLLSDVQSLDFSFLPASTGNNSFANKAFAHYRYLTKDQIADLTEHFKEQIDDFYNNNISNLVTGAPTTDIRNYWEQFDGNYDINQIAALKDWFYVMCDILEPFGTTRTGTIDGEWTWGNSYVLTLSDVVANKTYTPVTDSYINIASYFVGMTVNDLFIYRQNYVISAFSQTSQPDLVSPDPADPLKYGHGPYYIYKVFVLDEPLAEDAKPQLDKMVYTNKYTQGSLDISFQLTQGRFQVTGLATNKIIYNNNISDLQMCYYWSPITWASSGQDPDDVVTLPPIYMLYDIFVSDSIQYKLQVKNVIVYVSGCFTYADDIKFSTYITDNMKYTDAEGNEITPNIDLYKDYLSSTDTEFSFELTGYADSVQLNDTYDPQDSEDINGNGEEGDGGDTGNGGTSTYNVAREPVTTYLTLNLTGMDFYTVTVKNARGKVMAQLTSYGSPAYIPESGDEVES